MLEGNGHAVPVPRAQLARNVSQNGWTSEGATGVVLCQALRRHMVMSNINKDNFKFWLFFV